MSKPSSLELPHQDHSETAPLVVNPEDRIVDSGPTRSPPPYSYVSRHWRGDLSLPVSYWLNSFLGAFAVVLVWLIAGSLFSPTENTVLSATAMSGAWLFATIVTVWQLVGIWRAAGKHKARGGYGFWATAARFVVVFGFLGLLGSLFRQTIPQVAEYWRIAAGDAETGGHELHILRAGRELEYSGGITFGATDEVQRLLDADPAIRVIHLNSPGGRMAEARKLRSLIRERELTTYTSARCASACTIAFLGGVKRFIAPDAKLGFHRGSFPGLTGEELNQENEVERRFLIDAGVASWFADRVYSTPSSSMWWPTTIELYQGHVITGISGPDDFALSGGSRSVNEADIDKELQKIRVYAAIRHADSAIYSEILKTMVDAIRLGRSQAELWAITRPYVSRLSKKYLPVASNDAVILAAQTAIVEANAIGARNTDACYDFLYPHAGSRQIVLSDYLSTEAQERDLAATAAVIETGSTNPQLTPTEEEVSRSFKMILANLVHKYSKSDLAVLLDPTASTVNHEKACTMTSALYSEVLALPRQDAAQLLRYLFSQ